MSRKKTLIAVAAAALGFALVFGRAGMGWPATGEKQDDKPAYTSSIQVKDQDGKKDSDEAAQLASLAKIDMTQATSAALAQVPGTALKAGLENEDGNLVYSVEIKTAANEIKDVKVDAGNGQVLHVEADDGDEDND